MWLRIWLWWAIFSFLLLQERRYCIFYGYYRTECQVAGKIARMAENTPKPVGANISAVISKAESQSGIKLTQSQREAVEKSLGHSVSIITGGPGTGKTTIINTLIKIMEQSGLDVAVQRQQEGRQRG